MSRYKLNAFPPTKEASFANASGIQLGAISAFSIPPAKYVFCAVVFLISLPSFTHAIIVLPLAAPVLAGSIFTLLLALSVPATLSGIFYRAFSLGSTKDFVFRFCSYIFYHLSLFALLYSIQNLAPRFIRVTPLFNVWQILGIAGLAFGAPYVMYFINHLRGKPTFLPEISQGLRLLLWNLVILYFYS